ncbi:hypothetical protein [Burkholderia multivorans]|uniref:hypothetical protein n=1 Tax=Burkholderia multivorans TaxID=87883 RepID=UPI000CFE463D|nr:hypothetical protein [Burkholderia multivorans]MBR8239513.1 hypothetical protein [Burkholderia multivorans]PRG36688.1 hypothetical protein C6T52_14210 [Burkholderia multivorans]
MTRPPRPEQLAALTRIRECMAQYGEEVGAGLAWADFSMIDKATWSRWYRQVCEENLAPAVQPTPVAAAAPVSANPELLHAAEVMPVSAGRVDFLVGAMMAACDALQDYAWPRDLATGGRKLRNPMLLERSTRLRIVVLDLAHRRDEAVWGVERMRTLHGELMDTLLGTLARDSSDAARKVLEAFRALGKHICVSCNRSREALLGRNAKGTKPVDLTAEMLVRRSVSYLSGGEFKTRVIERAVDQDEVIVAVLRDEPRAVRFAFRSPAADAVVTGLVAMNLPE